MILISTPEFASNNKEITIVKLKVQQATNGIKWIKIFRNLKDDFRIGGEVELDHILQYPKDYMLGEQILGYFFHTMREYIKFKVLK